MRAILNCNLAAAEPLTPLNIDEAVHYIGCNLTNRLVHPGSMCDRCQQSQMVFDGDDEPRRVGRGVRGEIAAVAVASVKAEAVEAKAIEAMRAKAVEVIESKAAEDIAAIRARAAEDKAKIIEAIRAESIEALRVEATKTTAVPDVIEGLA